MQFENGISNEVPRTAIGSGSGTLTVWRGANLIKLHRGQTNKDRLREMCYGLTKFYEPRKSPKKRQRIKRRTEASKRRQRQLLAKLNRSARLRMITLTHERIVPAKESKKHLDAFFHAMIRAFPECAGIWSLEYQERGAPHYHILVTEYIPYRWIASTWDRICNHEAKHWRESASTHVKALDSGMQGKRYAAKNYLCKDGDQGDPQGDAPGRFWGIHNEEKLPLVDAESYDCDAETCRRILRQLSDFLGLDCLLQSAHIAVDDVDMETLEAMLRGIEPKPPPPWWLM